MKCPVCQAKLLPVDGELFCLQCGEAVHQIDPDGNDRITLEETSDPLLRRAITDALDGKVVFRDVVPVFALPSEAPLAPAVATADKAKHSFVSLRAMMAPPRPLGTNGAMVMPPSQPLPVMQEEAPVAQQTKVKPRARPAQAQSWWAMSLARTWGIGIAGLVLFVGVNLMVGSYYANRVYPGVRAGNVAVGGWTFDQLNQRLPQSLPKPALAAMIDGKRYDLDETRLGNPSFPELERTLKEQGRGTSLPVFGIIQSLFSSPIEPDYSLSDEGVARSVEGLEAVVGRKASDAAVVVMGTNVLVLAEKPGVQLDEAATAAAIRSSYGRASTVTLESVHIQPDVQAADYANDISLGQSMLNLNIQLTIKKATYTAAPEQIGSWLVFGGPGKGVSVNQAGIVDWVAAIPGSFDRAAAVNSLVAALNGHQSVNFSPSVSHPSANPAKVSSAANWPIADYTYCVDESAAPALGAGSQIGSVVGVGGSWTLGGRLRFTRAVLGCNLVLKLANAQAMVALDSACEHQTTCRIHNDLAISTDSWSMAPAGWVGDLPSFRTELVNHVVGQWLGFDHPNCSAIAAQTPKLSVPSVIIPGCSSKWYQVPPELQDTKVLAGF